MQYKKIGFIINDLSGGGAEKVILTLAEAMAQRGHQVHIFLVVSQVIDHELSERYTVHYINPANQQVKALWCRRYWQRRFLTRCLRLAVDQVEQADGRPFDLLVATLWQASRVAAAAKLSKLCIRLDNTLSQVLVNAKQHLGARAAARRQRRYNRLYRQQRIIAVSNGVAEDFRQHFPKTQATLYTIYNPMNLQRIADLAAQPNPELPQEDYIIHVARFAPQKRHDLLFTAYKQLQTPVKLVLLTKVTAELAALIRAHGLEDKVICPGFQPNPYPWIKRARLLVLCSDHEGLPTVVLESLACGTPVVSTDCPSGPREILTGDLAQWLTPVNDADALTAKLDAALKTTIVIDPAVFQPFCLETCVKQYLALCE